MGNSDLDFGDGSWDRAGGTVRTALVQHDHVLYGRNGDEGIVTMVFAYRAQLRLIVWLLGIFGPLCAVGMLIIAGLEYNRQVHQNLITPPAIFSSHEGVTVYAKGNESAHW